METQLDYDNEYSDNDNSNSIYSDDDYDTLDRIYEEEAEYIYTEKKNNEYVIGIGMIIKDGIFVNGISKNGFFENSYNNIIKYLFYYSVIFVDNPVINIFKLNIVDDCFIAVRKTIWICLLQRHWKKIYKKKMEIVKKRKEINSLSFFQIYGKWHSSVKNIPTIRGMLSCYSKS